MKAVREPPADDHWFTYFVIIRVLLTGWSLKKQSIS